MVAHENLSRRKFAALVKAPLSTVQRMCDDGRLPVSGDGRIKMPDALAAFESEPSVRILFEQGGKHTFMDLESYEQVELSKEFVGDLPLYVLPNNQVVVLWCDGKPISVEMPLTVVLTVTDTPPGIKGATATNQLKEATCETGLKTRVPPFITTGEKIVISTEDGSYRERA